MRPIRRGIVALAIFGIAMVSAARAAPVSPGQGVMGPVTILVAPLPPGSGPLEVLGDDLVKRLEAHESLCVVDRSQIERILAERALNGKAPDQPVLAYDLLLRMVPAVVDGEPGIRLHVVDLSTGNILGATEARLPSDENRETVLATLTQRCLDTVTALSVQASEKRVRVRLLGAANPDGFDRLDPFCDQLVAALEYLVERSPDALLVRHIEALTIKEESLLMLTGLSRLAGGRRFAPQADLTVEAELREVDPEGKTFKDTDLELRLRFDPADPWRSFRGKVSRWSDVLRQTGKAVADRIGEPLPTGLDEHISDLALRRSQAEAELAAATKEVGKYGVPSAARVAAAAKIDPTFEPAAFQLVSSLAFGPARRSGGAGEAIVEALRYLQRFPSNTAKRKRIVEIAMGAVEAAVAYKTATPEQIDAARQIAELNISEPRGRYSWHCAWMIRGINKYMTKQGVSSSERRAWLNEMIRRGDRVWAGIDPKQSSGDLGDDTDWILTSLLLVRIDAVAEAIADGDTEGAKQLARDVMRMYPEIPRPRTALPRYLHDKLRGLDDAAFCAECNAWAELQEKCTTRLEIDWPDPAVYGRERLPVPPSAIQTYTPMTPLVLTDDRLFGVVGRGKTPPPGQDVLRGTIHSSGTSHGMGYLPLNSDPVGDVRHLPDFPPDLGNVSVTCAAVVADTLFVGTIGKGMLACRVGDETWKQYGAEAGLPVTDLHSLHVIDERTLLCAGGHVRMGGALLTFDVRTQEFTLVRRRNPDTGKGGPPAGLSVVWRDGDKLMGAADYKVYADILGDGFSSRGALCPGVHGWRGALYGLAQATATIGDRRWIFDTTGLHEIRPSGKAIRSWWNGLTFSPASPSPGNIDMINIRVPCEMPHSPTPKYSGQTYGQMCQSGGYLVMIGTDGGEIVCYEPAGDMWYGPLHLGGYRSISRVLGSSHGAWIGTDKALVYLNVPALVTAAREAGRAMTSDQLADAQHRLFAASGPLGEVKYCLLHRDLEEAGRLLDAYLAEHPRDPEALLLAGFLHDFPALNRPEQALQYFHRLADLDIPEADHTGLWAVFRIHYTLKQWTEAIDVGEALLAKHPNLNGMDGELRRFLGYARRRLREQAATQDGGP